MKKIYLLLSIMTVLVISSCRKTEIIYSPQNNPQTQSKLQEMVDKLLTDYKTKNPGYPGGLALKVISKNGTYFVSSGLGSGITDQIHFRAASNTKSMTSTAIILLAQQGKLNIDAKISDIIPGTTTTYVPLTANYQVPYRDQITIRMLLTHTAGIFDVTNELIPDTVTSSIPYHGKYYPDYAMSSDPQHTFTFDELVGVDARCHLSYFRPGESYRYSNTGYSILGKIIERVSGLSYQQFIMQNIVQPMGLTHTTFPVTFADQKIPTPFAKGYLFNPGSIKEVTESNMSLNVAEGNMITTPDELSKFLRALLRGDGVLMPLWVNQVMVAPPAGSSPAGWYSCGLFYTMNLGFGHNGAHEGYMSRMVTDPQIDFTSVVFTNAWDQTTDSGMGNQLNFLLEEACFRAKAIVQ